MSSYNDYLRKIDCCKVGPQGPQGEKGNQGIQGATGPTGPTGPVGSVTNGSVQTLTLNNSPTTTTFNATNLFAYSWNTQLLANTTVSVVFTNLVVNGLYNLYINNVTVGSAFNISFVNGSYTIYTSFIQPLTLANNNQHIFNIKYAGSNTYYISYLGNYI